MFFRTIAKRTMTIFTPYQGEKSYHLRCYDQGGNCVAEQFFNKEDACAILVRDRSIEIITVHELDEV